MVCFKESRFEIPDLSNFISTLGQALLSLSKHYSVLCSIIGCKDKSIYS